MSEILLLLLIIRGVGTRDSGRVYYPALFSVLHDPDGGFLTIAHVTYHTAPFTLQDLFVSRMGSP